MLISCWSVKGGSGTTVVAAGIALLLARRSAAGARIADLSGDVPSVLGLPDPSTPGLAEWMAAGDAVPADALDRLAITSADGLTVLPWRSAARSPLLGMSDDQAEESGSRLASALAASAVTVVDCGSVLSDGGPEAVARRSVAASAGLSLLVLRPCYLALRKAAAAPLRPSAVVLVGEPDRVLGRRDVEDVLGVPVRAVVPPDRAVARAVDAGVLARRLPRGLERALLPGFAA